MTSSRSKTKRLQLEKVLKEIGNFLPDKVLAHITETLEQENITEEKLDFLLKQLVPWQRLANFSANDFLRLSLLLKEELGIEDKGGQNSVTSIQKERK